MALVIVVMKVMPESVDVDLRALEEEVKGLIEKYTGEKGTRVEEEPVAFGLKALKFTFVVEESKGSTDELEDQIRNTEGVNSCEVIDVRRALG